MQLSASLLLLLAAAASVQVALALPPQVEREIQTRTHRDTKWTSYSVGDPGSVGTCGFQIHKSAFGIALGPSKWNQSLCGRIITLKSGGKQAFSQVLDRCDSCVGADLNITEHLFTYFSSDTSTPLVGEWDFASS